MLFSYVFVLSQFWTACDYRRQPPLGANFRSWHGQEIITQVMHNYNKNLRPRGHGYNANAPTIISTNLIIESISTVKEQNMEYKAQFRFQQEWYDDRLTFRDWYFKQTDFVYMGGDYDQKIWLPDTFFQNEKDASRHQIDVENYYIKFRSDGRVVYDRRLSMIFSCIMDLSKYPMDSQTCLMDFASYAYTTEDIIYEWRDDNPLRMWKGVTSGLPNFLIAGYSNASCSSVTNTGSYSCLRVELKLQRVFSFFLLQLYVPSTMLVAVSWVSYWIDWRATAGRVPLAIITLLTMITQSHVINAALPPVSYTKAIDVWIGACVMFIFSSLIEYAIVNYIGIGEQRRKSSAVISSKSSHTFSSYDSQTLSVMLLSWLYPSKKNSRVRIDDSSGAISREVTRRHRSQRRPKLRSINRSYSPAAFEIPSRIYEDGQTDASMLTQTAISNLSVHFEDISNNIDWIHRKTKRRLHVSAIFSMLKRHGRAERIDIVSRTVFPIAFLMFNIVYWLVYW